MKKFLFSIFRKWKNFKNKLNGKKQRILLFFLLIWFLKVNPVKGTILLGTDGFPPNPINRSFKN